MEQKCSLNLVRCVESGSFGEGHGLRVVGARGGVVVVVWCGPTKAYATMISATYMRKRATSTMTN